MVEDSADSLMAIIGGVIAPLFAPLGFGEWQPVAASISGFTAKEAYRFYHGCTCKRSW